MNHEEQLDEYYRIGYYDDEQWLNFWWAQRATALQQVIVLQDRIKELQEYIQRCSERIGKGEKNGKKETSKEAG